MRQRILAADIVAFRAELVRWVAESLRPFDIVKDRGFQSLMKTGRPEYYIPSPSTVSRDVRLVFVKTRQQIAKMINVCRSVGCKRKTNESYQEYEGKLNFTTDGWSSPNHRALVAFSAHLEHKGVPLSLPLDIIEVPKVSTRLTELEKDIVLRHYQSHTGEELAAAFEQVLKDYGVTRKVSTQSLRILTGLTK